MADKTQYSEFVKTFPDYRGGNEMGTAADFVADKFRELIHDGDQMHHHVVCALDTTAMSAVFDAVKEDIFMKKIEMMNAAVL